MNSNPFRSEALTLSLDGPNKGMMQELPQLLEILRASVARFREAIRLQRS